jgi:hypothetical protein
VKADAIDLEAITEVVLAGYGVPVTARAATVTELAVWAMQRGRRIQARTATKNQLLSQLDRCIPGLTVVLADVFGTKAGRLVAAEFADPHRLAALGVCRFVRFAGHRRLRVCRSTADRLVAAAHAALPSAEARVARRVLADDLVLLPASMPRSPLPRQDGSAAAGYAVRSTDHCTTGAPSAPPTTPPLSVILTPGGEPASFTAPPVCRLAERVGREAS